MVEVDCDNCGETFKRKPSELEGRDNVFCSRECYHDHGRPDMKGENNPNHKDKATVTCEACGDDFEVHQYRADTARFCSRDCNDDFMAGRSGAETPAYKNAKKVYVCENCGDEFEGYESKNTNNYCSKSCFREASSEIFAGEDNPSWRGGYETYYGANWEEQRQKAIERDDHTCQDCGTHAGDMERSPDVHHKKRLGWFREEYDTPEWYERANQIDNLVTLCQRCHAKREWSNGANRSA